MRGLRRAARLVLLLGLLLLALGGLTHPGRVAAKTVLLLPDMFPDSPVRPLTWLTPEPRREEYNYDFSVGHVDTDIYFPSIAGRHGAVILLLGAVGFPRRHPTLERFADALSRAGAVVMIPESSNLRQGDILPGEVDGILDAVAYLGSRPEVDPERIGLLGFSVGGSLALLAAADERGRDKVAFVHAFGAYYDALDLLRAVVTHEIRVAGLSEAWQPSELTFWVFSNQIIATLPDERDRELLGRAFLEKEPGAMDEMAGLTPSGLLVLELLRRPSAQRVDAIFDALPESTHQRLDGISPRRSLSLLKSHLFLMHDYSDEYIPFVESRKLAAQAPAGVLRAHTEFDLFAHVMPDRPLETPIFVREVLKLYYHAWLFCLEFL